MTTKWSGNIYGLQRTTEVDSFMDSYPVMYEVRMYHAFNISQWHAWKLHSEWSLDRQLPIRLLPLRQNESVCEAFHMKMSSTCRFTFM